MHKRIVSLMVLICLLFNVMPILADNIDKNNQVIANTENFTEDNIIYSILQSMRGVSLLSDTLDEAEDNICADFDVVLGLDTSNKMYGFDYNGDKQWLDNFENLSEQVPAGTRFSVVTDEIGVFGEDLNSAIARKKELKYSGNCNIIELLDKCTNTFDDNSDRRNKIIVAAVSNVPDETALANKVNELLESGIIPFVFVLNKNGLNNDIEYVYECPDNMSLRIAISDLYLSLAEFAGGVVSTYGVDTGTNTDYLYLSDYKPAIHAFSFGIDSDADRAVQTLGRSMISVLNIYGCIPAMAQHGKNNYDLISGNKADISKIQGLFDKRTSRFSDNSNTRSMIEFWGGMQDELKSRGIVLTGDLNNTVSLSSVMASKMESNLKMRFPVILTFNDESHIVTSYSYENDVISIGLDAITTMHFNRMNDHFVSNTESTGSVELFDTYGYLCSVANTFGAVNKKADNESYLEQIHIRYPKICDNAEVGTVSIDDEWTSWTDKEYDTSIAEDGNKVLSISPSEGENLLIFFNVNFSEGLPNMYNSNLLYIIKKYKDITSSSVWYYDYVVNATNKSIINGYDELDSDGNVIYSYFSPEANCKRAEFVKIVIAAAGFDVELSTEEGTHWAENYMAKARELGILRSDRTDNDYYEEYIQRGEVAYILDKLYLDNNDKILVPTMLYKYKSSDNYANEKAKQWRDGTAFAELQENGDPYISDDTLKDSLYQMYMNNVMDGDVIGGVKKLRPSDNINRAEICKVIMKCLFDLDENLEQIKVSYVDDEVSEITQGEETNIILDNSGKRTCSFVADKDGRYSEYGTDRLYKISYSDLNTDLHVYDDNGYEIQVDKAEGNYKRYRLNHGQKVNIVFSNPVVDDIDVVINDCWSDSKRCYVTMYDSYSDHLTALGTTSRYLEGVLNDKGDEVPKQFRYTPEFFERYLAMTGNKNITLDLAVRDLDDGYTQYTWNEDIKGYEKKTVRYDLTSLAEIYCKDKETFSIDNYMSTDEAAYYIKNSLIDKTAEKYIHIIKCVDKAVTSLNKNRVEKIEMPEMYISTPYFVINYLTGDDYANRQENLSEFYVYITKCIYEQVIDSVAPDLITGLSFGREDPDGKYRYQIMGFEGKDFNNDYTTTTVSYNTMRKMSEFADENHLKFAWCPYSNPSEGRKWQWDYIASIVNDEKRSNGKPLLDVITMQPGIFYSGHKCNLSNSNDDIVKKINLLYHSVKQQKFLIADSIIDDNDILAKPNEGETSIAFQIEFDISLMTGRQYSTDPYIDTIAYPILTAQNFLTSVERFKDLLYNDISPIGFYPGGPNEIALNNAIEKENNNVHTRLNHPSSLAECLFYDEGAGVSIYSDEGETKSYSLFANMIDNRNGGQDKFANNNFKTYNNRLIYDIENALLNNIWITDLQKYLGIIQGK